MPAVARLGDTSNGHGSFPSTRSIEASPNVFFNGKAALRQGDGWATHCNSAREPSCHTPSSSGGSRKVFINGKPLMRVGDSLSCGDTIANGSPNIFDN
jgi:uncharacterized Zn-binding protein involved in type VI secretion